MLWLEDATMRLRLKAKGVAEDLEKYFKKRYGVLVVNGKYGAKPNAIAF